VFTVDGSDGQHEGTILRIGAGIDRGTRTLLVEATVPNAEGLLSTGAFCRAKIVVAPAVAVTAVPRTAVQSFAGVDRVFAVEGGKAKERLIRIGRRTEDAFEVLTGVVAGDSVVADPRGLVNGTAVTVQG
jgi:multidrug efflux pump subunit AcrA (membrane-fusion protein)